MLEATPEERDGESGGEISFTVSVCLYSFVFGTWLYICIMGKKFKNSKGKKTSFEIPLLWNFIVSQIRLKITFDHLQEIRLLSKFV